jgi:hypothetical protein
MEVSVQLHALAASPPEKEHVVPVSIKGGEFLDYSLNFSFPRRFSLKLLSKMSHLMENRSLAILSCHTAMKGCLHKVT